MAQTWLAAEVVLGLTLCFSPAASGQSLLDRTDNISSDWVGNSGTLYFNFVHRFTASSAPERKVTNFPTFLVATGIASQALIGFNYASNSALSARYPNEWEFFARYAPIQQEDDKPLDLGAQIDYNLAVKGVDGELSIARREGPVRLIAMTRVIADTLGGDSYRMAYGGGGTLRLGRFLALAADVASLTSRMPNERIAWSAGLHIALPNTPHTLSLHVSNANTSTLQGLSRGSSERRWGFEFTIPVHLARFFTNGEPLPATPEGATAAPAAKDSVSMPPTVETKVVTPPPVKPQPAEPAPVTPPTTQPVTQPAPTPARADTTKTNAAPPKPTTSAPTRNPQPVAPSPTRTSQPSTTPARTSQQAQSVNARIKGQAFVPGTIQIAAGGSVTWKNLDALIHTVTAADKSFDSGIIQAEGSYSHTFSKAGTYPIICTVHPFMKATVVVK